MLMPQGLGTIYYLGFDWFTIPAPTDWQDVLANQLSNFWDGSTNDMWSVASNWSAEYVPIAGDTAYFNGNVNTTVNHDQAAGTSYGAIVFRSGAGAFTIVGNAIGIENGGSITNNSAQLQTISVEVFADGNLTIDAASGDIVFSNAIGTNALSSLTVTGANDVSLLSVGGGGGLIKTGGGILTLVDASTYAAGTTLGGGTIVLGNDASLSSGGITVSANSAIQSNDDARSIDNNFAINDGTTLAVNGSNNLSIAGDISGQGALEKAGTGTLTLSGSNTYSGGTTVSAGTLEGTTASLQGNISNNAIVNFNQDTDGTYTGNMSGTGLLSKQGTGTVTITGNHTQSLGAVAFDGGLNVNGYISGEVTIGQDAVLSGTGNVGEINLYGKLAPGNSIGSLLVEKTATFNSGSVTEIEITDSSATPGTTHDWLNASNGATVNLAGTVNVLAAPGNYTAGTQYTFIDAHIINGTYDGITDDLAFFTAQLGYTPNSVYFTLMADATTFASHAVTFDQLAVAEYIDANSQSATGAFQDLIDDLRLLTTSQLQTALQQLSAEIYGTTHQLGIQNTTLMLHTLAQQFQPQSFGNGSNADGWATNDVVTELSDSEIVQVTYQPDGSMRFVESTRPRTTWVVGYGLGGDADSDGNATRLEYGMGGALTGFDVAWNRGHRIGLFGGYVGTGINTNDGTARNEMNSGQIGSYITGRNGVHYYTIISGLQFDGYDSERSITPLGLTARGDYDGWQGFGYLERGLVLYNSGRWSHQPFAGVQYVHVRQNGFTETGAGAANLSVAGVDDDSFRSLLGIRTQVRTVPNRRNITPEFRAVWVHEFLDTNSPVVATMPIGGSAFVAKGLDMGRDWALVGTGLNCNLGRGWYAQANYDAQVNRYQAFHVGSGSLTKTW